MFLDSEFNLKIGDFGFGSAIHRKGSDGHLTTTLGTPAYMAPEQHRQKKYIGNSIDIFASGVILFISVAQHPPFEKAMK